MRLLAAFACAVLLIGFGVESGHAEKRVALVIGNGAYANAPRLTNPHNDAEDVGAALKRSGFETIVGFDLDKAGMDDAEIRFARAARDADVAFFYYSGHAMQFAGINYLMPVDAKLTDEADLRRLVRTDDLLADLQRAKDLRVLVLDSCRDNPLADELKRSIGSTRSAAVDRGLARIDSPEGMIVAYATQAGRTAADGTDRHSPYTEAFLRHIDAQEEVGTMFRRVSSDVYEATKHAQLPELSLSLIGEFYLHGQPPAAAKPVAEGAPQAWAVAQTSTSATVLQSFIKQYGNTPFASKAQARLAGLADLFGDWENTDPATRGIVRLQIADSDGKMQVHAWGACTPSPCDWGAVPAVAYAPNVGTQLSVGTEYLLARFPTSFSQRDMIIGPTSKSGGPLQAVVLTRFTDGSRRSNYASTNLFKKK
ncbi:MAG: caspase domain-containing protein [Xanthobacteraceae bacterium]